MLDLHTHTNYSDGTWTVKELLKKAQESKIELLSITDHNNVKAHLELRDNDYTHIFNNRIINGVELNVIAHGSSIEVLVYDFDLDTINNWCLNNYKSVTTEELLREYKEMYLNALKHGIILDSCEYNPHECFPVEFIYNNIKKHSENRNKFEESVWNSFGSFLRYFSYDLDFPVYVNLSNVFPDIKDAVKVAHESGGKVFLAHLYKYPNKHDILLKYLTDNRWNRSISFEFFKRTNGLFI